MLVALSSSLPAPPLHYMIANSSEQFPPPARYPDIRTGGADWYTIESLPVDLR